MQLRIHAIISNANQSQQFPDTCYVDAVDLESGKEFQFSTKAKKAGDFLRLTGRPVLIEALGSIRARRSGGGYSVVLDQLNLTPGKFSDDGVEVVPEAAKKQ